MLHHRSQMCNAIHEKGTCTLLHCVFHYMYLCTEKAPLLYETSHKILFSSLYSALSNSRDDLLYGIIGRS